MWGLPFTPSGAETPRKALCAQMSRLEAGLVAEGRSIAIGFALSARARRAWRRLSFGAVRRPNACRSLAGARWRGLSATVRLPPCRARPCNAVTRIARHLGPRRRGHCRNRMVWRRDAARRHTRAGQPGEAVHGRRLARIGKRMIGSRARPATALCLPPPQRHNPRSPLLACGPSGPPKRLLRTCSRNRAMESGDAR